MHTRPLPAILYLNAEKLSTYACLLMQQPVTSTPVICSVCSVARLRANTGGGKSAGRRPGRCASVPRWSEPEGSLLGQDTLFSQSIIYPSMGSPSDIESSDGLPYPLLGLVARLVAGLGCTRLIHQHSSRIYPNRHSLLDQIIRRIDDRHRIVCRV